MKDIYLCLDVGGTEIKAAPVDAGGALLHQNTQVRTLLVQKRVRPDKKTAAEIIVLCGSFLFAGVALTPRGAHK